MRVSSVVRHAVAIVTGAIGLAVLSPLSTAGAPTVTRATELPSCTTHVDSNESVRGNGSAAAPWQRIGEAVDSVESGAIICVAEGSYPEQLTPREKFFTLAGGFKSGSNFQVRDSALYVSKALGKGGSFLRIADAAPTGDQLIAIDGFEISGYSQAIVRDYWESQRFDITNNFIHDNVCSDQTLVGAAFALNNVSGKIAGNVIRNNSCGRGGGGFLNDSTNQNSVSIENNLVDSNSGTEPTSAHGGGFYFFGNTLWISGNVFLNNSVTQWGGGLYIGAFTPGNQPTTATLSNNVFRGNRAGDGGGGFFCDDGAKCIVSNDVYERNCGGNILVDGGAGGSGPTVSSFDHITNVFALTVDCKAPGTGVFLDTYEGVAPDRYTFTNSIFWGNAKDGDFATACSSRCSEIGIAVDSSMVQAGYADGTVKIEFGAQNITPSDPLFVSPENGDFNLQPSSPAAGKGAVLDLAAVSQVSAEQPVVAGKEVEEIAERKIDVISVSRGPAIKRGAMFLGFEEKFNRYYTDPSWAPLKTVFVTPEGGGDGSTREQPMDSATAVGSAQPGTLIYFLRGSYKGGFELTKETSGTYDNPIILFGEAENDGSVGVNVDCNVGKRKACFNLEGADHIAVQGFEFVGGAYGVRVVGLGYDASEHSRGIAVINNNGHDQERDPFFSGQSDWNIWEGNSATGAGEGDGHGIYISNGSDWNIVRFNETHSNASSNFQINADPASTCSEEGIAYDDPRCDGYAGEGEGGRGASDYFLVENNYFHHDSAGPNFTSVRRSVVRNNIFGPQARHNVSFWQETENPKLGSSDNLILHNLFIASRRHGVQFANSSARNSFINNVVLGVAFIDGKPVSDAEALLMEIADGESDNLFSSNFYGAGAITGRKAGANEFVVSDFSVEWFENFPVGTEGNALGYLPSARSPYLKKGRMIADAPVDLLGHSRVGDVELGPLEVP